MRIRIENTYSDGYESEFTEEVPEFPGVLEDEEGFEEYVRAYTGDGHGVGRRVYSMHTVTVLVSSRAELVGRTVEFG